MMIRTICILLAATTALTACSSAKKQFGIGRQSPDEFAVVERAPLTLPPDYALRPPRAGGDTPQVAQAQAKRVILGAQADASAQETVAAGSATDMILQQAGATKTQPNIRATLDKESAVISTQNRSVAEKILFWDKDAPPAVTPAEKMDAATEAQRLNKAGIVAPTPGKMRQPAATPPTTTPAAKP